jgi:5-methylcytosine-specific restriction endonuclease McrA
MTDPIESEGVVEMWWVKNGSAKFRPLEESRFSRKHRFNIDGKWLFVCHYCERTFPIKMLTKDHKIPKVKGGNNKDINLLPACSKCNSEKGEKDYEVYLKEIRK